MAIKEPPIHAFLIEYKNNSMENTLVFNTNTARKLPPVRVNHYNIAKRVQQINNNLIENIIPQLTSEELEAFNSWMKDIYITTAPTRYRPD